MPSFTLKTSRATGPSAASVVPQSSPKSVPVRSQPGPSPVRSQSGPSPVSVRSQSGLSRVSVRSQSGLSPGPSPVATNAAAETLPDTLNAIMGGWGLIQQTGVRIRRWRRPGGPAGTVYIRLRPRPSRHLTPIGVRKAHWLKSRLVGSASGITAVWLGVCYTRLKVSTILKSQSVSHVNEGGMNIRGIFYLRQT